MAGNRGLSPEYFIETNVFFGIRGFSTLSRRQPAIAVKQNHAGIRASRRQLSKTRAAFAGRILSFGDETAVICTSLHIPYRRPDRDAMIAAMALEHGFAVVTRNTDDFAKTGVALVNPWLA